MKEQYKFPNGYEFTVVNKEDIINTIEDNIVDKELMFDLITEMENTALSFIEAGHWTGIPFLGNVRVSPYTKELRHKETKELLTAAKRTLPKEEFYVFNRNVGKEIIHKQNINRRYRYEVSKIISKHRKEYIRLAKVTGDNYGRFYMYTKYRPKAIMSEEEIENLKSFYLNGQSNY